MPAFHLFTHYSMKREREKEDKEKDLEEEEDDDDEEEEERNNLIKMNEEDDKKKAEERLTGPIEDTQKHLSIKDAQTSLSYHPHQPSSSMKQNQNQKSPPLHTDQHIRLQQQQQQQQHDHPSLSKVTQNHYQQQHLSVRKHKQWHLKHHRETWCMCWSLIVSLTLPLLFMFLLPPTSLLFDEDELTSTTVAINKDDNHSQARESSCSSQLFIPTPVDSDATFGQIPYHDNDYKLTKQKTSLTSEQHSFSAAPPSCSARNDERGHNQSSSLDKLFLFADLIVSTLIKFPLERLKFITGLCVLERRRRRRQSSSTFSQFMLASAALLGGGGGGAQTITRDLEDQLEPGGVAAIASARHDLQEEETHVLQMSPAEQRSSYIASAGAGPNQQQQQLSSRAHLLHGGLQQQQPAAHQIVYQHQPMTAALHQPQQQDPAASQHLSGEHPSAGAGGEYAVGGEAGAAQDESPAAVAQMAAPSDNQMQTRGDLPAIRALNVKCEKNHMTVNIVFDRPFYGLVFSKGHYNDQKCIHMPPNSGQSSVNFDIHLGKCGMTSSDAGAAANLHATGSSSSALATSQQQQQPNGLYIENVIIIQYDPQVQEIYDQARKLRCTWYDYYEKSVTFRPYNVDMLDAVTANFLGDNIQCWMQIQVGKGPWSSEVAGIVKIGQTMTMVLAIKDEENRFDMLVRNCQASDGKHQPIQLVDEYGCIARPKIMAKFQKVRNFGPAATVVSYAHFQAFKFPDSMSVHFNCVIQVCRFECPEPICNNQSPPTVGASEAATSIAGGQTAGGPGGVADYATSGTEIVASKEVMPMQQQQQQASPSMSNVNQQHSTVGLKLDETQGRVAVKLDTSMMTGISGGLNQQQHNLARTQSGAPLPPHLLQHSTSGGVNNNNNNNFPLSSSHLARQPQLAHHHQQQHTFMSASSSTPSSYTYKQQVTQAAPGGATAANQRHVLMQANSQMSPTSSSSSTFTGAGGRATSLNSVSTGHPSIHYSSPYQTAPSMGASSRQHHSVGIMNRMGELAPSAAIEGNSATAASDSSSDHDSIMMMTMMNKQPNTILNSDSIEDHNNRLAAALAGAILEGTPRALQLALPFNTSKRAAPAPNHRYRRATTLARGEPISATNKRQDSTSIRTQKTIQVVSPDDVAFSLLDGSDNFEQVGHGTDPSSHSSWSSSSSLLAANKLGGSTGYQSMEPLGDYSSTVCFSTARLMCLILFTLGVLTSSIIIVAFVVLRQRARLALDRKNLKVATTAAAVAAAAAAASPSSSELFDNNSISSSSQMSLPISNHLNNHEKLHQRQQQQQLIQQQYSNYHQSMIAQARSRQEQNLAQRNNYLARLYSQFIPATHWTNTSTNTGNR